MRARVLLVAIAALLLLLAGAYGYRRSHGGTQAAAADCADKPKPKNEFAMAAECDGRAEPHQAAPAEGAPAQAPQAP